jgi:Family of unknown function (DUF5343)
VALTTAYLVTPKNLEAFLNAVRTAQAPERMTTKFLTDLDFTSSNDRLFIGIFKALGFITESGEPTNRYFEFLDQSQSGRVLAQGIREAYDDLFRVNKEAYKLDENDVKNKLKTLTRGEKSENVVGLMAKTFVALSALADWSKAEMPLEQVATAREASGNAASGASSAPVAAGGARSDTRLTAMGLHYNIQIHLPASRDSAVYDAIFKSLKDHLLS